MTTKLKYFRFLIFLPTILFFLCWYIESILGIIISAVLIIAVNVYSTRFNIEKWVRILHYIAMALTFGVFLLKFLVMSQ